MLVGHDPATELAAIGRTRLRERGVAVTYSRRWRIAGLLVSAVWILLTSCGERNCSEPRQDDLSLTYVFRDGWSLDCGEDVSLRRFWYFECTGDSVMFVGSWDPSEEAEPSWWSDASVSMGCFDHIGCNSDPVFGPPCSDVSKTPRQNREAEEMALWLSGSLVAPDELYDAMVAHLGKIRKQYGGEIPALKSVVFQPMWKSDYIEIGLTEDAKTRLAAGEYHDLDSLNTHFRLEWEWPVESGSLLLHFDGRYNFRRLAEIYSAVPSVTHVSSPPPDILCSPPGVFPWSAIP